MLRGQASSLIDGNLPVFVFPGALTFYSDDKSSHKQVMTLYNPYDFTVKFKVLCTEPKKYNVIESEGALKARCCVDILVRHKDICINNEGVKDKFRIHVSEHGQKAIIGKKDVVSTLLPTREKGSAVAEESFESLPELEGRPRRDSQSSITSSRSLSRSSGAPHSPSWLIIMAAVLCIAALMLPSEGDKESRLPAYLILTSHQKLIAAYILGLVTMAILRS